MKERLSKTSAERARIEAAAERWGEARIQPRLWSELNDRDKERLAMRRLRSIAAVLGWDAVLHRIGIRRRVQD